MFAGGGVVVGDIIRVNSFAIEEGLLRKKMCRLMSASKVSSFGNKLSEPVTTVSGHSSLHPWEKRGKPKNIQGGIVKMHFPIFCNGCKEIKNDVAFCSQCNFTV